MEKQKNGKESLPTGEGQETPGKQTHSEQNRKASRGRSRRRAAPDLSAIFEEVDRQAEATRAESSTAKLPDLEDLLSSPVERADDAPERPTHAEKEQTGTKPTQVEGSRVREPAELFSRLAGEGEASSAVSRGAPPKRKARESPPLPLASEDDEEVGENRLVIPPELETYLSPDLWRRLKGPSPSRGVLINALERVRSILYLISTFLPRHLVQEKMRRPHVGLVKGRLLKGTLLFSDVSGFTALSERLAAFGPEGAERLTTVMNQYFTAMLEILAWSGGILLKFAGDATLVYFPEQEAGAQAGWAVRAGQRMLRAMSDFTRVETPAGAVNLRMKIGLATGDFLAASVGSEKRMEYVVLGQAIAETMAAEGLATGGGQLVLNAATTPHLDPQVALKDLRNGFYLLERSEGEELDDFEIKAEARRARGAIPWDASPHAIMAQVQVALRQIQALIPYLAPELIERIVVHARKRGMGSEYRPTTVLFCNFFGSEELLEIWGARGTQRVTRLIDAYFSAMNDMVARYGGIVSRVDPYSTGTKMLILFGAPVAHEDDPQRAVSAALGMNAELEALDEIWRRKFARHLPKDWEAPLIRQRFGITYGETFAGQVGSSTRREYTVMGDDVNLAARLMSAAETGRILLSKPVHDAVEGYFVLTERAPMRVKGKREPIPVFQVEGPHDDTLANRARSRGEFIGREAELARAEAIMGRVLAGCGVILTIQGAAGIGKSHLADEILKRAAVQNVRILLNQCRSYNAETPMAPWGMLLRALAGITSVDYNPQVHLRKFQRLMEDLELPSKVGLPLGALIGLRRSDLQAEAQGDAVAEETAPSSEEAGELLDLVKRGKVRRRGSSLDVLGQIERGVPSGAGQTWAQMPAQLSQREQDELYEAILALLTNLSSAAPLVIFFEDAHWMDTPSRELLRSLNQRIENLPLLFLLAQRGEDPRGLGKSEEIITLEPLNQADTTELVAHLLVSDLAQVIHEQSLGNPLYVDEITRWFKRSHNISAEELNNVLHTSDFLQKLVLSGLEGLPEAQREIAKAASVIGQEFRTGEIQALLPSSMDIVSLSNHLRGLVRERLITLTEVGADARYAFQQTLVRDILYNSLPYEQRRELHARAAQYLSTPLSKRRKVQARIAAALEAAPAINPLQEAETIAHHFEKADQWLPAAKNLLAAGDHAWGQQAYEKASAYYQRASQDLDQLLAKDGDAEASSLRVQAYIGQGDAALMATDYLSSVSAYEAALSGPPPEMTPEEIANLSCKLALVLPSQGRTSEAIKSLQKILGEPQDAADAASVATMAWLLWRSGRAEAKSWIVRCTELVSPAKDAGSAIMKVMLSDFAGDYGTAAIYYSSLGRPTGAALAAIRMGDQFLEQGDHPSALDSYRQASELWENDTTGENGSALALFRQAEVRWHMEDTEASRAALDKALEMLDQCPTSLQAHGRTAIQRALKVLARGHKRWPVCDWQAYDDEFRIPILFQFLEARGLLRENRPEPQA